MDDINELRERAEHWRAMMRKMTDAQAIKALNETVDSVEETIARLEAERAADQSGSGGR